MREAAAGLEWGQVQHLLRAERYPGTHLKPRGGASTGLWPRGRWVGTVGNQQEAAAVHLQASQVQGLWEGAGQDVQVS